MRQVFSVLVATLLCISAHASVKPSGKDTYDPQQSAALFVGIRDFTHGTIGRVPYALDDAVDLAYLFTVELQPSLVPARRVVLALSGGEPVKPASRCKLQELIKRGATILPARRTEIVYALRAQAKAAGRKALLIVAF